MKANHFDRIQKFDLMVINRKTGFSYAAGNIAGTDRAIKLTGISGLTHHDNFLAIEFFADFLRFGFLLKVLSLQLAALTFEMFFVFSGCCDRFFLRQQIVTGKARLNGDDITHLAELFNSFQQNNFHHLLPSSFRYGSHVKTNIMPCFSSYINKRQKT